MRRSHRGTGDSVGGIRRINPCGSDVGTRTEYIEAGAVVRVVGSGVVVTGGTDSDSSRSRSRRVLACIGVIVTSSNDHGNSCLSSTGDGIVFSLRKSTSNRKVGNRRLLCLLGITNNPVDTREDIAARTGSTIAHNFNSNEVSLLCNTVCLSGNSTRNVGTMSITISGINDANDVGYRRVPKGAGSNLLVNEVVVLAVDTSINNICINTLASSAGGVVVSVGRGSVVITVVGSGKAPDRVGLFLTVTNSDFTVLLNEADDILLKKSGQSSLRELSSISNILIVDHILIDVKGLELIHTQCLTHPCNVTTERLNTLAITKTDDVLSANMLSTSSLKQFSCRSSGSHHSSQKKSLDHD
mmetsp:Transcript_1759/g.2759  ORF Transcript_1759/g.2759 Transcript_1759/m.2759 type:complete len:356 (-) Transcript_1759:53-1120(-)